MYDFRKLMVPGVIVLLLFTLIPPVWAQMTPSVTVSDQSIEGGTVTVDTVVSDGAGWIVIHADQDGAPGPVIGHAAVEDGENTDVQVEIDVAGATETLHAMLHTDSGEMGTYEFPDADPPVQVDEQVVVVPFTVTGAMGGAAEAPETLPEAGGVAVPALWPLLLLIGGALVFVSGLGVMAVRRVRVR